MLERQLAVNLFGLNGVIQAFLPLLVRSRGAVVSNVSVNALASFAPPLDRYVTAFERADVVGLADVLRADVELEMPPVPTRFTGRDAVCEFLATEVLHTRDNGARFSPARTAHQRSPSYGYARDDTSRAHGIDVLALSGGRIAQIVALN